METRHNKVIAKNTMMLYFRMLLTMFIGLYTSRVILSALGVSDYGLYNVVGGVVTMFTFINGSLSAGTQRFITFELERGTLDSLKKVFSTSLIIHVVLAGIILVFAETIGFWFVVNKMNFPTERLTAAIWTYQFSIIACMVSIVQVPFMSSLIAHEKMSIYAYMGIYDSFMKLIVAISITVVTYDKLIIYAFLILVVQLSSVFIYFFYCRKHYKECTFSLSFDKESFKKMFSFSAWDTIGSMAMIGQTQGVNIVINIFCGTVVNAARGISVTVNNLIMSFVNNFLMAANPQIVKNYASGNLTEMFDLVINVAKLASCLLLLIGIPVFIDIEYLLSLWLGEYPEYAPTFVRIILIQSWIQTLGIPTVKAMHAIGNIKAMNLMVGTLLFLILPFTYLFFKMGFSVSTVLLLNIIPWLIAIPIRLYLLKVYVNFPFGKFMVQVILGGLLIALSCYSISFLIYKSLTFDGLFRFLVFAALSITASAILIYVFVVPKNIKLYIKKVVQTKIIKR